MFSRIARYGRIVFSVVIVATITSVTILIYINSLYPLSDLPNAETRISELTSRFADVTSDRDYLVDQYRHFEITWCAGQGPPLSNTDLRLAPLGNHFEISPASIRPYIGNALSESSQATIESISLNLFDDLAHLNLVNIKRTSIEKIEQFTFAVSVAENFTDEVFAADFILKIGLGNDANDTCSLRMRLHFSPDIDSELPGYEVKRVIGRNGQGRGLFSLPYGTEFFGNLLWVSDCTNENISLFSSSGEFIGAISEFGSRMGKLDTPADIKVFDNQIYVVEELNHRVQVFDLDGSVVDVFGAHKETEELPSAFRDKFSHPLGISVIENQIAVVDYGNNRIVSYDHDWNALWVSGNSSEIDEPFQWDSPYYIEYSSHSDMFVVSNQKADELSLLSSTGDKIRSVGRGHLNRPHEVAIDPDGNILVADTGNHQLVKFLAETDFADRHVLTFPISFGLPKTVAVNEKGEIAIGFVGNGFAYLLLLTPNSSNAYEDQQFVNSPTEEQAWIDAFRSFKSESAIDRRGDLSVSSAQIYSQYCSHCHEAGRYGAPVRGNVEAWDRFPRSISELVVLAKAGRGAMIPNGGCTECTDDMLEETIVYMLPSSWSVMSQSIR